ncbi:MAG TPA: acetyl-coenzyme A synthetase N-terminal domain-containing protein, partial [Actinomycetota bacterium]|nr:acetyl-coenzyme A synthetase N-terminal domain-containing protein [Actinomycetota bacterium]
MDKDVERTIEALLQERRLFQPPESFVDQANAKDVSIYAEAERDPDAWWAEQAERLDWFEHWDEVLRWDPPHHEWFVGGKLNASHNCLDRHLGSTADRVAFHWIGEPGDKRSVTYRDLHNEVCRLANVLKELGIEKGDRVAIYMPMI